MQKIRIFFLAFICAFLVSCSKPEVDAEITIMDANQEEITYTIQKTEDKEKIKQLFEVLGNAKIKTDFNGFSLSLDSNIEGKIKIEGTELRTIDLGYDLNMQAKSNLKKYRIKGTINLDGFTKTDSNSFSFDSKQKLKADFENDDAYVYLTGSLDMKDNYILLKNKLNIENITENYKAMIISSLDVLKYYTLSSLFPDMESFINEYDITISNTTKDTFTLSISAPVHKIFPQINLEENLKIDVTISCLNLLPTEIGFEESKVISLLLENEYVEQYLSSKVTVEKALLKFNLKIDYGYYTIEEMTDEQKKDYQEYLI